MRFDTELFCGTVKGTKGGKPCKHPLVRLDEFPGTICWSDGPSNASTANSNHVHNFLIEFSKAAYPLMEALGDVDEAINIILSNVHNNGKSTLKSAKKCSKLAKPFKNAREWFKKHKYDLKMDVYNPNDWWIIGKNGMNGFLVCLYKKDRILIGEGDGYHRCCEPAKGHTFPLTEKGVDKFVTKMLSID